MQGLVLLVIIFLAILVGTAFFQFLWNACLVGAIVGVNPIGFWQALGLSLLFNGISQVHNKK